MKIYKGRGPDKETESFRMWKAEKDDVDTEGSFTIKHKGQEFTCCGFTLIKFKIDEGMVLYYDCGIETEKFNGLISMLKMGCKKIGYELCNIADKLKILEVERGSIKEV